MSNDEFVIPPVPTDDKIRKIASLGKEFIDLTREIEEIEYELNQKKKVYNRLSTETIPEAMHSVGMTAFEIGNQYTISVAPVLVVKLDNSKVDAADVWLDKHGHSGMVKRRIEIFIPKDVDKKELENLKTGIEALDFDYSENSNIHYQTLNAWARHMDENGEVIPTDIFSVYRSNKTVIKE